MSVCSNASTSRGRYTLAIREAPSESFVLGLGGHRSLNSLQTLGLVHNYFLCERSLLSAFYTLDVECTCSRTAVETVTVVKVPTEKSGPEKKKKKKKGLTKRKTVHGRCT